MKKSLIDCSPNRKWRKKTYTMNELPVPVIGNKAVFVAEDGCMARVFWSDINGHHYYNWDGKEEKYSDEERYNECFVLSVEFISPFDNKKYLFEEQLEEKQGCIGIYCKNKYDVDGTDPSYYRYRKGLIGFIEEKWYNKEGWDCDKTAYSEDGKLLVDQWEVDGIPGYISVAYIADLDALYVGGT